MAGILNLSFRAMEKPNAVSLFRKRMLLEGYPEKSHVFNILPQGSRGKESTCNAGDTGSDPGSGRSPWEGHGNLLQYACLENSMDRGAQWATVHGVAKSQTWLSDWHTHTHTHTRNIFCDVCNTTVFCWKKWKHGILNDLYPIPVN